jgi:hypothetical protein
MSDEQREERWLELARQIRPFLVDLVAPAEAVEVDRQLADLLDPQQPRDAAVAGIKKLLAAHHRAQGWSGAFLDAGRPPELLASVERGYSPLPGISEPPPPDRYRCPAGDYVWYRVAIGRRVPDCPTHGTTLERDSRPERLDAE